MLKETLFRKIKKLFCIGPMILLTIFAFEVFAFILKQFFPMTFEIQLNIQIYLTAFLGIIFIFGYICFMLMLGKYNMGINIIKRGPYRIVRHPLYSIFIFIIPVVILIWVNDLWFLFSWVMIIVSAHFVVKAEEKFLIKKFGKDYIEYKVKVPALIPYKGIVKL